MSAPFRIGIAGLGTVGRGVVKILQDNADIVATRAGRPIEIVAVSARDKKRDRGVKLSGYEWHDDPVALASVKGLDAVVEVMGGSEGSAKTLIEKSLAQGVSVVTANKALLALHGAELAAAADKSGAQLKFEAAVAGGIPIIKSVREGFAANKINAGLGILNGTCNYILTEMRETGRDFSDVLKEAQAKGYAEADPTFDVDGIDAAHKLCVLSALAFGLKPDFKALQVSGIRHITAADIAHAGELGYKIKLLGIARNVGGKIVQGVEPCLVPAGSSIGSVEGVYNAVYVDGDFVNTGLATGRGAGEGPTASAVVADLIDIARGFKVPAFGVPASALKSATASSGDDIIVSSYYLHVVVLDQPGVLADISAIMRDHKVSMESVLQRGHDPEKPVSVVIKSHKVKQADIKAAVAKIGALKSMASKPCLLRIENF